MVVSQTSNQYGSRSRGVSWNGGSAGSPSHHGFCFTSSFFQSQEVRTNLGAKGNIKHQHPWSRDPKIWTLQDPGWFGVPTKGRPKMMGFVLEIACCLPRSGALMQQVFSNLLLSGIPSGLMIWRISWRSSFMVGFFRRISWWTQKKNPPF